jgi:hypothetical protein
VRDLSNLLDELAIKDDQLDERKATDDTTGKKQVKMFKRMFELYTPHQIQWIIRIILKGREKLVPMQMEYVKLTYNFRLKNSHE